MVSTIQTAVPLDGHCDLEEPLLSRDEIDLAEDEEFVLEDDVVEDVHRYAQQAGWTIGFLMQCLSLGSTAAIALIWDGEEPHNSVASRSVFWVVFGMSHSSLMLFPMVCLSIERSWNESGIEMLQSSSLQVERPIINAQTRRMTFVASVRFLVGIVFGCFVAWGLVDMYLGAPPSMLCALGASMVICLSLCYGMVAVYDTFTRQEV